MFNISWKDSNIELPRFKNQTTKTGLTVTKKIESAVQKQKLKNFKAILEKNKNLLRKPIYFELIAKKEIIKCKYEVMRKTLKIS